ncbi:DUF6714 family protein [Aquimarina agarivorans]|uniref:DUF6714 family protein n=1 Tax=Aquimarina agarivorans TaxID=980584 RepID=UPI000248E826|nr:DUF6714 family protein [Aquimarina agarivorans]
MKTTPELLIQSIAHAFQHRKLPKSKSLFMSNSSEIDTQKMEQIAFETEWINFPNDILLKNSEALNFMNPEAFAWLLPAYLILSITLYSETDTLTGTIINCLTLPDDADANEFESLTKEMYAQDPEFEETNFTGSLEADKELLDFFYNRVTLFNKDEEIAIRNYLIYINEMYGKDFPVYGPKNALDRYWLKAY